MSLAAVIAILSIGLVVAIIVTEYVLWQYQKENNLWDQREWDINQKSIETQEKRKDRRDQRAEQTTKRHPK